MEIGNHFFTASSVKKMSRFEVSSEEIKRIVDNVTPVSIKHGLRTTDYRLRTGYKTRTGYKMQTKHYGLGITYRLRYKTRTEYYGLSIKHEEMFYIE